MESIAHVLLASKRMQASGRAVARSGIKWTTHEYEWMKRCHFPLALDGKTLRGTIPLGETRGVHLLAAYLPKQGVVLAQMSVDEKSNEITHAPKLLKQVDLRGVIGSSDAMFDQRDLSVKIVEAKARLPLDG